jgi:hypothetical protein
MPSGLLHYALVDIAQVLKTIQIFFCFHNARLFHVVQVCSVERFSFKKAFVCLITEPAVQPSTRDRQFLH